MESDIKVMQFNLLALAPEMHGWEIYAHREKNEKAERTGQTGREKKWEKQKEEQEVTENWTKIAKPAIWISFHLPV